MRWNQKTQEMFINEANKKFNGRCDYTFGNYVNMHTPMTMYCPIHKHFTQKPMDHLKSKYGCPKCGISTIGDSRKMSHIDFKIKAKKIHGDNYDYNNINYIGYDIPMDIYCNVHKVTFSQKPSTHLQGKGCPICAKEKHKLSHTKTESTFLEQSLNKHGDRYDYSKVKYTHTNSKVSVKCRVHGIFEIRPSKHLEGVGCPKCSISKGELSIVNYLDKNNIQYVREYRLDGYKYRYDFYLPQYSTFIEYHGMQHFIDIGFFNKGSIKNNLKRQQRNDKIKMELAKRNNNNMIIISHLDIKNIPGILDGELINKTTHKILDMKFLYNVYKEYDNAKYAYNHFFNILVAYLNDLDINKVLRRYGKSNHELIKDIFIKSNYNIYKYIRMLGVGYKVIVEKK